ncbi:hypothetical protein L9F63_011977, partial [Diploptera punctata]
SIIVLLFSTQITFVDVFISFIYALIVNLQMVRLLLAFVLVCQRVDCFIWQRIFKCSEFSWNVNSECSGGKLVQCNVRKIILALPKMTGRTTLVLESIVMMMMPLMFVYFFYW